MKVKAEEADRTPSELEVMISGLPPKMLSCVEFVHYRIFYSKSDPSKMILAPSFLKRQIGQSSNDLEISGKGGVTIADGWDNVTGEQFIGIAVCSLKTPFCKYYGRKFAEGYASIAALEFRQKPVDAPIAEDDFVKFHPDKYSLAEKAYKMYVHRGYLLSIAVKE